MLISDAEQYFYTNIAHQYDKGEANEILDRLLEQLTGRRRWERRSKDAIFIDEELFLRSIVLLHSGMPIQYVLGYEWFDDIKLMVNEHVLIPRPETAELVKWVVNTIDQNKMNHVQLLDIGTGSGCIAIAIKNKRLGLKMMAIDISEKALELAKLNATNHQLDIRFMQANILDPEFVLNDRFDMIISNPPYITIEEQKDMLPNVLLFEPKLALFVSNHDPLQFYKAILSFASKHLNDDGFIFLELNRDYAFAVQELYQQSGFSTELKKDIYGTNRMLKARKPI